MKIDQIKIDPDMGAWTPELVAHHLEHTSDEEFEGIYGKSKVEVRMAAELELIELQETKEELAEIARNAPAVFGQEEQIDLDTMHWKQFQAKYGMKPSEFIANREEKENEEIV